MKKTVHKLTSLVLCAALALGLAGGASAFRDVAADSTLKQDLSVLREKGVVNGIGGDTFRPNAPITVAELCTFLGRIAGDDVDQQALPEDLTADGWSGGYVAWARALGLVDPAAGQYDKLTRDGVNFILANFCALVGTEAVTVDSAIEGGVTRGEAMAALAALAQTGFDRVQSVQYATVTEGQDWGPAVTKVILDPGVKLDPKSISADKFAVSSIRVFPEFDPWTYELLSPSAAHLSERAVTAAYASDADGSAKADGDHITLELAIGPDLEAGSPFWYNMPLERNEYVAEIDHLVATTAPLIAADGTAVSLGLTTAEGNTGNATLLADDFDTTGKYVYSYDDGDREIALTYASWFPEVSAAEGSTPLIIWLHGMGEGGTNPNVAILGNKVVNLITDDVQQYFGSTGAAVLAPQSPTMWLDTSGSYNMAMGTANSESFYTEALMSLIVDFVNAHPEIDAKRLYIGGCSNGGYMTINMLIHYPGAFAAAYPVCEPYSNDWLTEEKLQALVDTPIWLTAAKDDMVTIYEGEWDENGWFYNVTKDENGAEIPIYDYSNALFDRLTKAGNKNVHYSLFDHVSDDTGLYHNPDGTPYRYNGHWSWIYALNNACVEAIGGEEISLFAWLAAQEGEGKLPSLPLEKKVYEEPIHFYLIRHGQTEYNVQGVMQGWTDSPLTEGGAALSAQLGAGLADIPFAAVYSSDSGRAVDTAKNVLAGRDIPITTTESLREMYFGEVDGQSSEGVYTEENMGYRFGVGFDDLGGETWDELGARMHAALEQAALEHRDEGGNILISTHGMSILAALYTLVPDAEGVMEQGEMDNCSVTILEWDNGVYTLRALNDTSYLQ